MHPAPRGDARLYRGDARRLDRFADASVDLVVTSPPYPMIPQWDGLFHRLGADDYDAMHRLLAAAWGESRRVLVPGGILAIVIGDALRRSTGGFRLWPNHADTLVAAVAAGFQPLPYILWKKPTNKPNPFLGSGFLPPNAYVTLDCEFVLLLRNGPLRRFPPHDARRTASALSRRERDLWFSQVWSDVRGARQQEDGRRTGAFPAALPERLIRMFSVVGDTVLDPFAGTGTTVWAAARLGRRGVGVEWDPATYAAAVRRGTRLGFAPTGASPRSRPADGG